MSVVAAASPDRAVAGGPGVGGPPTPTRPPRLAADAATWRGVLYLLLNFPLTLLGFIYATIMLSLGLGLVVTVVGIPLLAVGFRVCRRFGDLDRVRAGRLLGLHVPKPSRPPRRRGFGLDTLADPVAWRHALYLLIRLPWGIICLVAVLLLLIVGWVVLPWATRGLVAVDKAMIRGLLSPSAKVERRVRELAVQQAARADSAAHLRRIERNLHDGAQARLVALAMGLGMAKEKLAEDPQAAALMVAEAHGEAKLALVDLRDLARGINPAILTDRGLPAALASLADRCTVPTRATVELMHRPPAAVEGIIYFTASELLTNISKHSQATSATIDLRMTSDASLLLEIGDDGVGGVDPRGGTGLTGLTGRVAAINGVMTVDSPPGGPTVVRVKLPWPEGTGARG
ncbi:sensor histidine kinase [Frankia sp. AgKG'84/4]|uniref:sensor histidine kinase n=1 Tax=Frankia sp. AgKG'84/4 TaxID=573490 RepID=UPI00200C66AA|nr:sensor histidine kinase [Frankia sp. AgKG'84/4]MCL9793698.1 sensor domain-containing protein [Frankia sp. AgKG'84/4]